MKKILITGAKSGIGKYLHEHLGGVGFTRENAEKILSAHERFDVIIHCAYNSSREVDSENVHSYFSDTIGLTEKLLEMPHKLFIFFSTVDVYPRKKGLHKEDEIIPLDEVKGMYAITKLISESLVRDKSKNFLILRPTGLLGEYSKKGSLMKVLTDALPAITLTKNSEINCVLYPDILGFIQRAMEKNIHGIYNIASSQNITPVNIAKRMNKKVSFGRFEYNVGAYDTSKAVGIIPAFKKTSEDAIRLFAKNL